MLDILLYDPRMSAAWRNHLSHGDIVLFRFPLAEEGETAKPKARPCLVLDIEQIGDQTYALLAYGTTSRRKSNVGDAVHVRKRADYIAVGLHEPTRFVGARRLLVALTHSGFVLDRQLESPVLGRIDGEIFERMDEVRGRIHALRDIRNERRRARGPLRRKVLVRGRDFVVEPRDPSRPMSFQTGDHA